MHNQTVFLLILDDKDRAAISEIDPCDIQSQTTDAYAKGRPLMALSLIRREGMGKRVNFGWHSVQKRSNKGEGEGRR